MNKQPKDYQVILEDKYLILKKLAEGGRGKLYLGQNISNGEAVIVKVNAEKAINDSEFEALNKIQQNNL